jgi:hypothetical protein
LLILSVTIRNVYTYDFVYLCVCVEGIVVTKKHPLRMIYVIIYDPAPLLGKTLKQTHNISATAPQESAHNWSPPKDDMSSRVTLSNSILKDRDLSNKNALISIKGSRNCN